ncbi:hypothetical protein DICPUDRAFT_78182 [Dictyostelium purpureum]|uniref:Carbohydrate binding domain-containing protein n=1 Tax=Dictyostelium purpureum TaxID=5786 RepID=F0ZIT1_DICPU|nr:uncharacterized protein DICPUDRAFT_78182 [Dictyostelium purpureum]EGC36143.1 hypothetical protein DICPUDRAFT_78182 [Dictyostelium purpureum]|eukprot:XP_003287336.1 hypothetical protein DICPUDRAFT_78182 [Dictyostelium purpureum]
MKFIFILLGLLLSVAVSSASLYPCGPHSCPPNQVCRQIDSVCNCIPINDCHEVTLTFKFIGSWKDGSRNDKVYSQYDVIITNNLNRDIKNIYIGSDYTLRLRDGTSIWNVVRLPNGVLTLPSYQPSINSNAQYTFGFIIEGTQRPNLQVLSVTF